jgi:hypothetical protein
LVSCTEFSNRLQHASIGDVHRDGSQPGSAAGLLLRESYGDEQGRSEKRTLANLSKRGFWDQRLGPVAGEEGDDGAGAEVESDADEAVGGRHGGEA